MKTLWNYLNTQIFHIFHIHTQGHFFFDFVMYIYSQADNHPQEDLAKFGYRPFIKVEPVVES